MSFFRFSSCDCLSFSYSGVYLIDEMVKQVELSLQAQRKSMAEIWPIQQVETRFPLAQLKRSKFDFLGREDEMKEAINEFIPVA